MALKFFDDTSSNSGSLPFLQDFIKKAKSLKQDTYPVVEITRVRSDKGYMVKTEKFMCFLWKNQKITGQLIEALEFYIESGKGYEICVFLPDVKKDDFKLGVNFEQEVTWFTSKNGFTTTQEESVCQGINPDKNPFLPD